MSRAAPDRALRKLVAELAQAEADDVAAILQELDGASQRKVKALLLDYAGGPAEAPESRPLDRPVPRLEGFSPWLADRLSGRAAAQSLGFPAARAKRAPTEDFNMTPAAVEALRTCAGELDLPEPQPTARRAVQARDWLASAPGVSRLKSMLLGSR